MKFLIICAGDRSKHYVALNALRLLSKNKKIIGAKFIITLKKVI